MCAKAMKCIECGRGVGDWHRGTCSKNLTGQPVTGVAPEDAKRTNTGPELMRAEKICTRCGETKNLSEFPAHKRRTDGRASDCKACNVERVKANYERVRQQIGEEAFRARQREAQRRYREKNPTKDRLQQEAYQAASVALRERHRKEFDELYRRARYERGLAV